MWAWNESWPNIYMFAEFQRDLKNRTITLVSFNSQTTKNYNSKHPVDHMDEKKALYTYLNIKCIHDGESRKGIRCHQ